MDSFNVEVMKISCKTIKFFELIPSNLQIFISRYRVNVKVMFHHNTFINY